MLSLFTKSKIAIKTTTHDLTAPKSLNTLTRLSRFLSSTSTSVKRPHGAWRVFQSSPNTLWMKQAQHYLVQVRLFHHSGYSRSKKRSNQTPDMDLPLELTLYNYDGAKVAKLITGVIAFFSIVILFSAEFSFNHTYEREGDGYVLASLPKRLAYVGFFLGVFAFILGARYIHSRRIVRKIDLLPNGEFRIGYYDIFSRKFSEVVPIKSIVPDSATESASHYSFKIKGRYFYFLLNKNGSIGNLKALTMVLEGKNPMPTWTKAKI